MASDGLAQGQRPLPQIGRMMTVAEITGEGGSASPVIGDTILFATTLVALSFALIPKVRGFLDDFRDLRRL